MDREIIDSYMNLLRRETLYRHQAISLLAGVDLDDLIQEYRDKRLGKKLPGDFTIGASRIHSNEWDNNPAYQVVTGLFDIKFKPNGNPQFEVSPKVLINWAIEIGLDKSTYFPLELKVAAEELGLLRVYETFKLGEKTYRRTDQGERAALKLLFFAREMGHPVSLDELWKASGNEKQKAIERLLGKDWKEFCDQVGTTRPGKYRLKDSVELIR